MDLLRSRSLLLVGELLVSWKEKTAVLCTAAMPTHAIRWADSCAELWGGGMIITEVSGSQKKTWEKKGKKSIVRGSTARFLLGSSSYSWREIGKIVWRIPNRSTSHMKHKSTETTACHFLLELGFRVKENVRFQPRNWGNIMPSPPTFWLTSGSDGLCLRWRLSWSLA